MPLTVIESTQAEMTARMLGDKGHAVQALAIRKALEADAKVKAEPCLDHLPEGDGRNEDRRCRE